MISGRSSSKVQPDPEGMPIFFRDFDAYRRSLSRRLHGFIETLSPALRTAAARFPIAHGFTSERLAWPSIYFLLPFWVQSDLGLACDRMTVQVAYANACLAYTVLIQDHVFDDEHGPELCPDVIAANVFFFEGIRSYSSVFPVESTFWLQAVALMHSSWNALVLEKEEHGHGSLGMLDSDKDIQQAKVNTGKIAALAIAMLAKREDAVPQLFRHLDQWQLACQMMDDFLDYRSDCGRGNYTQFLVLAGVTGNDSQSEVQIQQQLGSGVLRSYFERVLDHYERARVECPAQTGYLCMHIEYLIDVVERFCSEYDALLGIIRKR